MNMGPQNQTNGFEEEIHTQTPKSRSVHQFCQNNPENGFFTTPKLLPFTTRIQTVPTNQSPLRRKNNKRIHGKHHAVSNPF